MRFLCFKQLYIFSTNTHERVRLELSLGFLLSQNELKPDRDTMNVNLSDL